MKNSLREENLKYKKNISTSHLRFQFAIDMEKTIFLIHHTFHVQVQVDIE